MRGGGRQQPNWKLDDERRQRLTTSSDQIFPITANNYRPGNYTHERSHTGIRISGYNTDVDFIISKRRRRRRKCLAHSFRLSLDCY